MRGAWTALVPHPFIHQHEGRCQKISNYSILNQFTCLQHCEWIHTLFPTLGSFQQGLRGEIMSDHASCGLPDLINRNSIYSMILISAFYTASGQRSRDLRYTLYFLQSTKQAGRVTVTTSKKSQSQNQKPSKNFHLGFWQRARMCPLLAGH